MLEVNITRTGREVAVTLAGSIDDTTDLFKAVGVPTEKKATFICDGITRVNSVGVKIWIKYFLLLKERGVEVTFDRISAALVDQLNSILNFNVGGKILTVQLPFQCNNCKKQFFNYADVSVCRNYLEGVPDAACPQCGGTSAFDEVPAEYFEFTIRL
jgi:hypothetical protein